MSACRYPDFPLRLPLTYTDGTCLKVLHDLDVGDGVRVKVIGDPENGAYEWCIEREGGLTFSDSGYGLPEIALRDGLTVWYGDSVDVNKLTERAKTKAREQLRAYQPRDRSHRA